MISKPYCIEWRPLARDDLNAIVAYISWDNATRARNFGEDLHSKIESLALQPKLGRQGRPGLQEWLRELVVHPNYIVFYRVLDEDRTIEILRVKHAAQQIP